MEESITMANPEVSLRLPMSIDSSGSLLTTTNESLMWADRLKIAIGTRISERVMRPSYGTRIGEAVFNTVSSLEEVVRRDIFRLFSEYFPLLTLGTISTNFVESTGQLFIEVVYQLPNKKESTTTVGVVVVSSTNPTYEELA
jgi:phage baseplate assembly protein W